MFLKSLEMVGFKSFADRIFIEFHEGMTAIVGPNGCGKSNVLDAMRWVLGEQSARALRGGTMQDVIFAGADSRKALGMAEVSLTFSNCEEQLETAYNEVRITRRVFRDGQGEYEINKKLCRLRDVQQLFMDTGIGRTAYSIMEQGKIDAILSSKPEERRAVFEEAAGITRFKSQKKEALRKLEGVDSNLLRLADILKEVDRQIGSLQRQAAKARRYQEICNQLRQMDTCFASHQFKHLKQEVLQQEKKIIDLQTELDRLQQQLRQKEDFLRMKRLGLEELEEKIKKVERERDQFEYEKQHAHQEIKHHEQRTQESRQWVERNEQEMEATRTKILFQQAQQEALREDLKRALEEEQVLQTELQKQEEAWQEQKETVAKYALERESFETLLANQRRHVETIEANLNRKEEERKRFLLRLEKLHEDEKECDAQKQQLQIEKETLAQRKQTCETALAEAQISLQQSLDRVQQAQEAFDQARQKRDQIEAQRAQWMAQHQALKQLVDSHTGYSEITRDFLKTYRGSSLEGTLLEHIHVRPGYEKALELCLGLAQEALLVAEAHELENVAQALQNQGSVVLVAPQVWRQAPIQKERHQHAAVNFIEAGDAIRGWMERLLANWYIAQDSEHAKKLRGELPEAHVVSLQGELWHGCGWQMRGQKNQEHVSILTRDNQLRHLEEELKQVEILLSEAQAAQEAARIDRIQLEQHSYQEQQQQQKLAAEINFLRYEQEIHNKRIGQLEQRAANLSHERTFLAQQDLSPNDSKHLEEELQEARKQIEENKKQLENSTEQLGLEKRALEEQAQRMLEARIQASGMTQQVQSLTRQQEPLEQRLQELDQTLHIRSKEATTYRARIEDSTQTIEQARQKLEQFTERSSQIQLMLEEQEAERRQYQKEIGHLEEQVHLERLQTSDTQTRSSKEEIALAQQRMHLNALVERIQRSYQIELEQHLAAESSSVGENEVIESQNLEALETQVAQLRDKLDQMGPVNLEAIGEFEELQERQTFLRNQQNDLIESKKQLLEAIHTMDRTSRAMFSETFAAIQTHFAETFTELFGGGKASLTLTEEADPLDSGIEIIAKPPGKQLQNISLLSGGEKTMTAVALLFSIYKVKPSPFCILDEMDAPLDESNIGRFIEMLKKFLQDSQFIVITHNKKTIAAADILYGVTMEEHGVSKIISVRLTRQEEDRLRQPLQNRQMRQRKSETIESLAPEDENTDTQEILI